MSEIKKIAILTSGGDSPGMNASIRGVVDAAINRGIEPYLVYEGYYGLTNNFLKKATKQDVKGIEHLGGTVIYSARFPEFKEPATRQKAVKVLNDAGIEALVVIGGDGSYMGASKLTELGIKTIGLPGTIDNDIASTDYTIGFVSALQALVETIDEVRATAESHNRAIVVEAMGRYCGELALYAGLATSTEVLSIPERKLSEEEIIKQVKQARANGNRSIIVLVTEHMYDLHELEKRIESEAKVETRTMVVGHIQRGARPQPMERFLAKTMAEYAVECLAKGETGVAVNIVEGKLQTKNILEVVKMQRKPRLDLLEQYDRLK